MDKSNFDDIDRSILRALQGNARLSMLELSDTVGLSPTPCARRVRRLEADGFILDYHAQLNESAIGYGFSVFVSVQLDKQVDDALQAFEHAIEQYPEVVNCWLMTGNRDYLMRIAVADLAGYESFLTGKLTKIPGVASIESSIPIRQVKAQLSREI
ncbi:Lrp/AsnC family transcriptional regulator [Parasphingorhabdus halotolerans]|uniref:Lrp/AsnC family transcriptional regulator n=2 Tax=Parasphingorhabdus halotolerans TaxID=2725558 RepID=A0A6H2DRD4_9SPHN|nr:Lrp/AsnC family transcriptional regulator [Parasphingorhabdus halotolerans]